MRLRSWAGPATFIAATLFALAAVGCGSSSTPKPSDAPKPSDDPNVSVGDPLYSAKPEAKSAPGGAVVADPLMIPSTAQYEERQQISSEVDAKIDLIGTHDPSIDPKDPNCVYHPRDVNKQVKYRALKEGDTVKSGQVLCRLDDQSIAADMKAAEETKKAAQTVEKFAIEGVDLSKKKLALSKEAWDRGNGSLGDYLQDAITLTRFEENRAQALQTIAKADADFEKARIMLHKHQVKSVVNGIVRSISKRSGEVVKAGEKILEIQGTDTIRLEGSLDIQYQPFVKRGMMVSVEPSVPSAPLKSHALHRMDVTGIAVSANPGRPLVVSVSADGSARVWDVTKEAAALGLPHPVPVRSVACSPIGSKPILAVTGGDDGKVRVWDLANPDKLPAAPREMSEMHSAAIGAVAFSPDGRFFATAAGREVFVWNAADGKKLYALPAEHRDVVTCLHFTPQCTLITASKDRSIKVWKLGAEKAAVAKTIDHRAGIVDLLGVSSDGSQMVFDQDKNRLDLVALVDRQTVGQIQNSGATASFATLAVFSANDKFLVTAGGDGELKGGLQVWTVPTAGGRGGEVARLSTPARVAATAAAFSPSPEHPFLAVGTEKGTVHLWKPPTERKPYPGRVVYVDATDSRQVTVRVEMDNRELNLLDRSSATVIINPEAK